MKRSFENTEIDGEDKSNLNPKVILVEREFQPGGVALVNPMAVAKKTFVENMELEEGLSNAGSFIQANARNKLDMIGRQMKNLQELMVDVITETKVDKELHNVACNFVKKPGNVYHLYERPSGQKYFGMLSPQEWVNAPHRFLCSYRLEADQSWTPSGAENTRYEGLNFLREIFSSTSTKSILNSSR